MLSSGEIAEEFGVTAAKLQLEGAFLLVAPTTLPATPSCRYEHKEPRQLLQQFF